jgi:glycosyltransferase involved in cell wall biosynthesis
MTKDRFDVTVLLPCYNEEEALPKVITDIRKALEGTNYSYEILVVDDQSTDQSVAVSQKLGCRVICRPVRRGAGAARKTGILAAKGEIIVMLDADGTYAAEDIPKMLSFFPVYDQVNGARTSEQGTLPWLRGPAKWAIRKLASFISRQNIPDLNTGLKAFKKEMMIPYLWTVPDGFSCVSSMTLAFLCNGHPVKYFPTSYRKRIGVSKFHPIKDTYNYILTVFRLITYFDPLRVFFPIASLFIIVGVIKSLYDYYFVIRRLQLSDIILILSGIVIGLQGLLADLIVAQARARNFFIKQEQ